MAITLLPQDPTTLLLDRIAAIIRDGIADCTTITAPDNVPWPSDGTPSPAEHYMLPTGWHLYTDRQDEDITTPALIIAAPEDGKEKAPGLDGMWAILIQISIVGTADMDPPTILDTIADRLLIVLTSPLTLDDATISLPQHRLTTATLHCHGSRSADNFETATTGKVDAPHTGHPERMLTFTVTCSRKADA